MNTSQRTMRPDFSAEDYMEPIEHEVASLGQLIKSMNPVIKDVPGLFEGKTDDKNKNYDLWNEQQYRIMQALQSMGFGKTVGSDGQEIHMMGFGIQGDIEMMLSKPYRFVTTTVDGQCEGSMMNSYAVSLIQECQLLDRREMFTTSVDDISYVLTRDYIVPCRVTSTSADQVSGLDLITEIGTKSPIKLIEVDCKKFQLSKYTAMQILEPNKDIKFEVVGSVRKAENPYFG